MTLFRPNGLVTLTTDFGTRDGYVGAVKGVLLTMVSDVTVVDVTHDIPAGDVRSAAFVLRNLSDTFPEGTVHVVVVDPTVGSERAGLVVAAEGYAYVGPDHGLFTPVFEPS